MISAKEAARISEENDRKKKAANAERARKAAILAAKNERKRRADFLVEFMNDCQWHIKSAVGDGRKKTRVYIGEEQNSSAVALNSYDNHGYLDLIKKVIAQLVKNGYNVSRGVQTNEYTTQHESSVPDYDYYRFHAYLEIEWK